MSLLPDISDNMCIVIVFLAVCDVINFEIYLSFSIKVFSCITKKSEHSLNILRTKRVVKVK